MVWFDAFESMRLSGLGWVGLLRAMQAGLKPDSPTEEATALRPDRLRCARCRAALLPVRTLSRFGRSAAHSCPREHGQAQSFTMLLAERGLVRPLSPRDRRELAAAAAAGVAPQCLNCGAALAAEEATCTHCDSPRVVLDVSALMSALLVRHGEAVTPQPTQSLQWSCQRCGAALDPTLETQCGHCGQTVMWSGLVDLAPILAQVEPLLRSVPARGARPWGPQGRADRSDWRATDFYRLARHVLDPDSGAWRLLLPLLIFLLLMAWARW